MASQNSGEGKLIVKRGRKKKINQNDHNATLNKLEVCMRVDNVEETNMQEQHSNVEKDNPNKETDTNDKYLGHKDAPGTIDIGEIDTQAVDNSDSVTETLGSIEFPIDVELAADFEDITGESLCDISMNTDFVADGNVGISDTHRNPEQVTTIIHDAVTNECSEALAENLLAGELHDPTQVADDEQDDVMQVEASETSHNDNDQAVSDGQCNTKPKRGRPKKDEQPKTKRRGRARIEDNAETKRLKIKELRAELMKLLPEQGEIKFSKEANQKIRLFLKREKKLPCPRDGCKRYFQNLNGFEYHVMRCGVSVSFTCEHCGSVYKSAGGLAYHERVTHNTENTQVEEIQDDPKEIGSNQGKSKYTFRQRSQPDRCIPESNELATDGVQEPENSESDSEFSSGESEPTSTYISSKKTWMNYSEILEDDQPGDPEISTEFSNMTMISKALREKSILQCPQRCGRYFKIATRAYQHIKECKGKREKHRCKLCGKILQSRYGIRHHIISKHRKKEHNSENDEESEFSESEQTTIKGLKQPQRPGRSFKKDIDYEEKTKAWYEAFLAESVLTCWRPSLKHWKKLPASEAEHYLPVRKMSPVFKIEAVDKKKWTPEQDKEYQLPLFSSSPINSAGGLCNVIFNVGGSVWAMDWAPMPVGEENCDQYLAIGCHSDPDKKHLLSECYKEKGVLQIWRVPKLRNGIRPTEQPEFCLGIVHDYGPLWDVRWCPSGAWDTSSPQAGELRRLGLLALACADGKVRIFSVPFPCSLVENDGVEAGKSPEDLLYRAVPHMVLSPGSLCRKYQDECGAAWTVSWQPINGHNKVIASYADGTVAIWNLKTDNRILKAATPDGLTECIFPISHFQAHNSVVRGLAWCPSEPNYIATGGYDKLIKIWDLRHTSQPVMYFEKVWSYHLTWPVHWGLLVYNTDVVSRIKGTRCLDYHLSSRSDKHVRHISSCYITHNAAGWDNDYSLWTNVVASVDAAGIISMNFLTELVTKRTGKMTRAIFRALVEPIVQCEDQTISKQDVQNGSAANNTEKDHFKIVFKDTHPLSVRSAEEDVMFNETAYVQPDQPTHTALHKVRWNPNFSSYYWLATAGRSGLVRLCYVNKLKY